MSEYEEDTASDMVWIGEELIADLRTLPILLKAGELSKEKVIEFTEDMAMILEELCGEVEMLRRREAYMKRVGERWEALKKARRILRGWEVDDEST
jgi:hypothetical protein